jgi:hypothetical protein
MVGMVHGSFIHSNQTFIPVLIRPQAHLIKYIKFKFKKNKSKVKLFNTETVCRIYKLQVSDNNNSYNLCELRICFA